MAVGLSVVSQVGWANVLLCAHRLLGLLGDEKDGEYRSYHFDYRGSTVVITDQTGKVVERFQYGPYGELLKGEAAVTPFLFNGKFGVMSDDNGLYYMRARFYSAAMKRFINMDVLLGNVGEGQTLNRYAFVTGRPVSLVDPFGLQMIPPEYSETANDMSAAPTSPEMNLLVSLLLGVLPGGGEILDAGVLFNGSSSGGDKLNAGVSLVLSVVTAGISPNFGALIRCANEVSSVANKFNLLKCVECAKAIIEVLEKHGIRGRVIEIRMPEAGNIWHEGLRTNIFTNGRHVAVEVDGIVYDNIHKQGIPRAEWEQQFLSIYGGFVSFKVTEEEFRKWLKQLHEEQAW